MRTVASFDEMRSLVGDEIGVSEFDSARSVAHPVPWTQFVSQAGLIEIAACHA